MEDEDNKLFWIVEANRIQKLRREYMKKYFPVDEKFWCIIKSCATLRQLAYETFAKDPDEIKEFDGIIDEVLTEILGEDVSGCVACRQDRQEIVVEA